MDTKDLLNDLKNFAKDKWFKVFEWTIDDIVSKISKDSDKEESDTIDDKVFKLFEKSFTWLSLEEKKKQLEDMFEQINKIKDKIEVKWEITEKEIKWLNDHVWKDYDWDKYIYNNKSCLISRKGWDALFFINKSVPYKLDTLTYRLWNYKDLKDWVLYIHRELIWEVEEISFVSSFWFTYKWLIMYTNNYIQNLTDNVKWFNKFSVWSSVKSIEAFKEDNCLIIIE
jgi:hypothetical protein